MSNDAIEALLAEASRLYNEGDYRRAIQKWEEALSIEPGNQKARESIKIASLLSDTWSEGEAEPAAPAAAAAPQTPQEVQMEDGLARIRAKLEARDFQGAYADCEALASIAGEDSDLKSLTEQARSGLEAEPFINAALVRARKELQSGNFEMVGVLCSKVLSLDAGNRDARTYLYMAQRRTSGDAAQMAQDPAPAAGPVAVSEAEADAALESILPPNPAPEAVLPPSLQAEPAPIAASPPDPLPPASAPQGAAEDPLAALGMDLGADVSPMDLAGPAGQEAAPWADSFPQDPAPEAATGSPSNGVAEPQAPEAAAFEEAPMAPSVEAGQEAGGVEIESIPLAGVQAGPSTTRQGRDIIQDGSIYGRLEEEGEPGGSAPSRGNAAPGGLPETRRRSRETAPVRPAGSASTYGSTPAATERPRRPSPAPPRRGGGGLLKTAAVILLLGALGAGGWFVYQIYFAPVEPDPPPAGPRPVVAAASGPRVAGGNAASNDSGAQAGPEEDQPPAEEPKAAEPGDPEPVAVEPRLPEDPGIRMAMAQARYRESRQLVRSGKLVKAKAVLEEVLELDPMLFEAKDLYDEISQQLLDATRFEEDIATVRGSMEDHDYHTALWKLYRMQEAFPSVPGWNQNIASAWYNWGVLLLKAGNLREAIDKFDEALGIDKNDREAIRQRRVAERYLNRTRDVAYHSYVDVLEMRPFTPVSAPTR